MNATAQGESLTGAVSGASEARAAEARPKITLWTRVLIRLGARSRCCGAKIYHWDTYKPYCTHCGKKI